MGDAFRLLRIFAQAVGFVVIVLWLCGSLGLGDFVLTFKGR